jgi:nucleolar protein 56
VNDNYLYAKLAKFVVNKSDLSEKDIPALADLIGDEDKAKEIVEAAKASMGNLNVHNCYLLLLSWGGGVIV